MAICNKTDDSYPIMHVTETSYSHCVEQLNQLTGQILEE